VFNPEGSLMGVTQELHRLGQSARRLNEGSDHLNRLIAAIDQLLGKLMIGLDYVHERPLDERISYDRDGKRVVELAYLGYLRVQGSFQLAIRTVRVFESKAAFADKTPGDVVPILSAPRRLRYAAVDMLPDMVSGLAQQVDDVVNSMERRCRTARALLEELRGIAGPESRAEAEAAAASATSHRRPTVPCQ
jgi:hypothetical protein